MSVMSNSLSAARQVALTFFKFSLSSKLFIFKNFAHMHFLCRNVVSQFLKSREMSVTGGLCKSEHMNKADHGLSQLDR